MQADRSPGDKFVLGVLLLFALVLAGCGARTGPFVPEVPASSVPPCSSTPQMVHVSVTGDPEIPTTRSLSRVSWSFVRLCTESNRVRRSNNCLITQNVQGTTEVGGDCVGEVGGLPPAGWHVASSLNRPDRVAFDFVGDVVGNICVHGTATFTDGTMVELGPRTWRAASGIPDIQYLLASRPVDPAVGWTPSAAGCFR